MNLPIDLRTCNQFLYILSYEMTLECMYNDFRSAICGELLNRQFAAFAISIKL